MVRSIVRSYVGWLLDNYFKVGFEYLLGGFVANSILRGFAGFVVWGF